jgi:translation initiation factor IF-3
VGNTFCSLFLFLILWRCIFINYNNQDSKRKQDDTLVNEAIRFRELRLIDKDGNQAGIISARDAQRIAREQELDLVCVAPQAKPPVCRIMDYGKYRYEQQRHAREAKKNQKVIEIKEIRLTPTIDTHDFETKARNARKFLEKGNKVIVSVRFRGRMMKFTDQGQAVLDNFAKALEDIAKVEGKGKLENRQIQMTLAPLADAKK